MTKTMKRRFTDEFKRAAVALWEMSGRLRNEVASELGRARMERDILKNVDIYAEMPRCSSPLSSSMRSSGQ